MKNSPVRERNRAAGDWGHGKRGDQIMGSGGSPTTSLMDQIGFERPQTFLKVDSGTRFRKIGT